MESIDQKRVYTNNYTANVFNTTPETNVNHTVTSQDSSKKLESYC